MADIAVQPAAAIVGVIAAGVYGVLWGYRFHKEKTQVLETASRMKYLSLVGRCYSMD